jgi:hypothetical protein
MRLVSISDLPHSFRDELYDTADGPSFRRYDEPDEPRQPSPFMAAWATLPIPMPKYLSLTTDGVGRVIAAEADGLRIHWADLDMVVKGVEQHNEDLRRQLSGRQIDDLD